MALKPMGRVLKQGQSEASQNGSCCNKNIDKEEIFARLRRDTVFWYQVLASSSYFFLFSQHTPIFPIFQQYPPNFPIFLATLHLTFISYISFQLFFFLQCGILIIPKNFPAPLCWHYFIRCEFFLELFRLLYLAFGGLGWLQECWETIIRYNKMCNLHQITNKYMNKVPIFLCKIPIFLALQIPIFLFFLPFLLLDTLQLRVMLGEFRVP